MTWIRFGRNEPQGPSIPIPGNRGESLDLHRFRKDGVLVLFFTPPGGVGRCRALFAALAEALLGEHDAELLVVSDSERDLESERDVAVGFDRDARLRAQYAGLMAVDSAGRPLVFVLDRDGSPVYAWAGDCDETSDIADELMKKLQSAAFLCPECSVPDPAASAMWGPIY